MTALLSAEFRECDIDETPTVEMEIEPIGPLMTLRQWEAWDEIRWCYPNALLDPVNQTVFVPQADIEQYGGVVVALYEVGLYGVVEFTQTVFTPGFSIDIGTPYLTGE